MLLHYKIKMKIVKTGQVEACREKNPGYMLINCENLSGGFINYTISDNSDYLVVGIILLLLLCLFGINCKKNKYDKYYKWLRS